MSRKKAENKETVNQDEQMELSTEMETTSAKETQESDTLPADDSTAGLSPDESTDHEPPPENVDSLDETSPDLAPSEATDTLDIAGEEQHEDMSSAQPTTPELTEDAFDMADKTEAFTLDGEFSGPLDIERQLEEELAALDAELAAPIVIGNDIAQSVPMEPEEEAPEEPDPLPASKSKRRTSKSAPVSDQEEKDATNALAVSGSDAPKAMTANAPRSPANFYQANFRHLDRNLTEPERQEWNDIYASFRSQSVLTGTVVGVDQNELPVKNSEGKVEMRTISSLVVIGYRVKVLIPENAVWVKGEERETFLMRGMIGATVDYVIISVDREGEVALASRALALVKRRRAFSGGRTPARPGDMVDCSVLVVGPKRCLITCGGYDVPLRPEDMSYTSILDMRRLYRPGQELKARVISHNPAQRELGLSVREATSNPFVGAERRHPVGSRRQAVITSKYKGGVFCTMADGTVCLCLYSNMLYDSEFFLGDNVIIYIAQYDYKNQHIYGRIVSKW